MKKAHIFSGQGSQYIGMDIPYNNYSKYCDKYFKIANEVLGYDIYEIIKKGPIEKLNNTTHTQPAIFIISTIAHNIYIDQPNPSPDCYAGHSLGEITALHCAHVLSFEEALTLIQIRARSMNEAGKKEPGGMIALIKAEKKEINRVAEKTLLAVANLNSPKQTILSGKIDAINQALAFCKELKIKALKLPVSGAFHSPLMSYASDALLKTINQLYFRDAIMPIYQNYSALPTQDKNLIKDNLIKQLTSPVRWEETINNMVKDEISSLIEFGPKSVLTNLNRSINSNLNCLSAEELLKNEQI